MKTRRRLRMILLVLLVVLIAIQFIHPARNQQAAHPERSIAAVLPVPEQVNTLLRASCYDCHSNNTVYPWYDRIQPVAWYLDHHVREGKRELNFDEFASYPARKQAHKLKEIADQIKKDEMPISSYTLLHRDARLSDSDKQLLISWATAGAGSTGAGD